MKNFIIEYRKGIIAALTLHVLILIVLISVVLTQPIPPEPQKGILIDLGNSDKGLGDEDKGSQDFMKEAQSQNSQEVVQTKVQKVKYNKTQPKTSFDRDIDEIEKNLKQIKEKTKDVNPKKEYVQVPKAPAFARQAVNKNALFPGGSANGDNTPGDGNTEGTGNMGNPNGTPGTKNYTKGGNVPGLGSGIDFDLKGRSIVDLYKPVYKNQEEGVVIMKIVVDKNGNVTNAEFQQKGSTTSNNYLVQSAKQAALKTKFNSSNKPYQIGTITYVFVLK